MGTIKIYTVDFKIFPQELLMYKYCQSRVLENLRLCSRDDTDPLRVEDSIKNPILWMCPSEEDKSTTVKDILNTDANLQEFSVDLKYLKDESSDKLYMNNRLIMVFVKLNKSSQNDVTIDDQSKRFLTDLKVILPHKYFQNSVKFFINLKPGQKMETEMAMMKMKTVLDLPFSPAVLLMPWNFDSMRDILHNKLQSVIHGFSSYGIQIPNVISLSDLHRMLQIPTKSNTVTEKLRDTFSRLRTKGYAGHVYIDARLTVYVKKSTDNDTIRRIKETSEEQFDEVDVCFLQSKDLDRIKMCTQIAPDDRAENHLDQRGTLGALAKLKPDNEIVAVSIGHFSSEGKSIKSRGAVIGKCIWPSREPYSCSLNDVSITLLSESLFNSCSLLHHDLDQKRLPLSVSTETPIPFVEVFKGREDVGFTTGVVTAVEAQLPYQNEEITAYLVEGDMGTNFANDGDSGSVVKLKYIQDGKLVGIGLVFGFTLELPNIRRNTCITIP